jgi:hypothetical protein
MSEFLTRAIKCASDDERWNGKRRITRWRAEGPGRPQSWRVNAVGRHERAKIGGERVLGEKRAGRGRTAAADYPAAIDSYARVMPSREAVLGFMFGVAVIAAGFAFDLPRGTGLALVIFIFGGWAFFSIRERRGGTDS